MESFSTRERYINFYTDFAFKRLFGTEVNKDLLISFLNALFNGEEKITDIQYLNPEKLGTLEIDRKAVFDVYCQNDRGEYLIVEMQKGEQQFFKDRSVFYSTFPIREQAKKGDWDYQLKGVYTVGILNFCFDDSDPNYFHHEVKLMDTQTKEVFYDKLTYVYLEMPKFNKSLDELYTIFDKWLYAMRHLPELLEKPQIMEEEVFTRLFEQAEIAHFTRKELQEYEESLKAYRDWYSVTKTSFDKGVAEGIQQGREEGRAEGLEEGLTQGRAEGLTQGRAEGRAEGLTQGRAEGLTQGRAEGLEEGLTQGREKESIRIAKNLKAAGTDLKLILQVTGLTISDIEDL